MRERKLKRAEVMRKRVVSKGKGDTVYFGTAKSMRDFEWVTVSIAIRYVRGSAFMCASASFICGGC